MKNSPMKLISDGLVGNNPVFVQFLGMCSALAITTSITNAVGMGIAVTAVLICSNVLISILRKLIVPQIRIAAFIVIISGFVTAVELLIKAYLPALDKSLGLFIPLIVVNCMILARAEAFASKNGVFASAIDGLAMGLGYTVSIVATAAVRELLGTGKLLAAADGSGGFTILGDWYSPANIFILPPGAFLTLAFLCALFQKMRTLSAEKKAKAVCASEDSEVPLEEESFSEDTVEDMAEMDDAADAIESDEETDENLPEQPLEEISAEPHGETESVENEVSFEEAPEETTEEAPEETVPEIFEYESVETEVDDETVVSDDNAPVFFFGDESTGKSEQTEVTFDFSEDDDKAKGENA